MNIELTIKGRHSDTRYTVENISKIEIDVDTIVQGIEKQTLTTPKEFKTLDIGHVSYKFFGSNSIVAVKGEELKHFILNDL